MPRATALFRSMLTVIHCGLPRGHWGGWVHTVNYTSHPLVWFIALITVGSLKKEKGEEAYKIKKIKKRLKVPQWQGEGENCVWGHVGAVGLLEPGIVYCCKLLWGWRSQLTVATRKRQRRCRTSEQNARQCADGNACCCPIADTSWQRIALWCVLTPMNQSHSFN